MAVLALLLTAGAARTGPIIIDPFDDTTNLGPPGVTLSVSSPLAVDGNAQNDPAATALGGVRGFGLAVAVAAASGAGNTVSLTTNTVVAGSQFTLTSLFTSSGNTAADQMTSLGYGADPFISVVAGAGISGPSASTAAFYSKDNVVLADFSSQAGIELDFASLDAAAASGIFTLGLIDTAGHVLQLSLSPPGAGPQNLQFPFASFGPGVFVGPFHVGVAGAFDFATTDAVALIARPSPGGNFSLDEIRTFQATPSQAVPEPTSLALLALGTLGLLGYRLRRRQEPH